MQPGQIRERDVNDCFVEFAQSVLVTKLVNNAVVKGKSAFADFIKSLPIAATIDYMHCVLLGVFPEILKLCYKALPQDEKIKVNIVISQIFCPPELIAYSRKICSLQEMAPFNANENFNWPFYISPFVFRRQIPEKLYGHLLNFRVKLLTRWDYLAPFTAILSDRGSGEVFSEKYSECEIICRRVLIRQKNKHWDAGSTSEKSHFKN